MEIYDFPRLIEIHIFFLNKTTCEIEINDFLYGTYVFNRNQWISLIKRMFLIEINDFFLIEQMCLI